MSSRAGDEARHRAYAAAVAPFIADRSLPHQVFGSRWGGFVVFDSDLLLDSSFVPVAHALLQAEDSECLCLTDLRDTDEVRERESIYIDRGTTPDAYSVALAAPGPGDAWVTRGSVLALASDSGGWAAYCEQMEEFVIVGFRAPKWRQVLQRPLAALGARTMDEAIDSPTIYTLENAQPTARDALRTNYGNREGVDH